MDDKLQILTDRLYAEGVEKGKNEAAAILEKANAEAADIIAKAQIEANTIIEKAKISAVETAKNTRAELKLYTDQALNALKSEITNLVSQRLASESVKAATADATFMQGIITSIAQEWVKDGGVNIDAKNAADLEKYFEANAKNILSQGVKINEVKGHKTDFTISPANGGYKISFGDDEFIEYFKEFLRPQLIELLF